MVMKTSPLWLAWLLGWSVLAAQTSSPFDVGPNKVPQPSTPAPVVVPLPSTPAPPLPAPPLLTLTTEQKTGAYTPNNSQTNGPRRISTSTTGADGTTTSVRSLELSSVTASATASTWVEITVHNLDKTPVEKLTVRYVLFGKSTTAGTNGTSTSVWSQRASETVDVPASGKAVVSTSLVEKNITNMASNSIQYGGVQMTTSSTKVSDIVGWYVECLYRGQVVKTLEHPDGVLAQYGVKSGK